jgi:hypothetical protein
MSNQVGLMGGLGNQLFQLAAALEISEKNGQEVFLNPNVGHCRMNKSGFPEIASFNIPDNLILVDKKFYSWWLGKLVGHNRKIGINPSNFEKLYLYKAIISAITRVQIRLILGRESAVEVIEEIGFEEVETLTLSTLFIGYFQTFRFTNSTQKKLMDLTTKEYESVQETYKKLAGISNPLVIHVRLGDYLVENNFGIPDPEYYEIAIEKHMSIFPYDSFWLFSDDLDRAISFIPERYRHLIRRVSECQDSSAATLQLMRFGKGYIIGNSTFSWWGAKLSHTRTPLVVAPQPWFKAMPEPKEIIPLDWLRVEAWKDQTA